ncbi:MAG: N-acetylmuramoyl-L-alanine amidase [Spirochaetales bacterium]|nr:N-acetylmuramoyl-L-alanine amidase [Spirochaetales bacterium]
MGRLKPHILFSLGVIVTITTSFLYAGEEDLIEMETFLKEQNARLLWNPVTDSGMITKKGSTVSFKPGASWILFDYRELKSIKKISRENGRIVIPASTAAAITSYFTRVEKERLSSPHVEVILIDPGHGGKDPGALYTHKTKNGTFTLYEKDLTLKVALTLDSLFRNRYPEKKIILTRRTDMYLKLEERVEIANDLEVEDYEAVVYISIHFNASFNKNAKGYEVWYLPSDYRRNLIDEKDAETEEKDIIPILNTMLEEEYTLESITLATDILGGLDAVLGNVTINRGMKEESWFVVRNARMPSVLLELGFITNSDEAVLLSDPGYLNKCSTGIYNGICTFINRFEQTKGFTQ